jgi:pantetheine-phosphate adenylyltransferase
MTKTAIYPGTFDPLTNGHVNIIQRSSELFDDVLVAVATSAGKMPLFNIEERVDMAQKALADFANVEVIQFSGLLVDLAKAHQANIVVRGIRSIADFEYETQMAGMNRKMLPSLETVFLTTHSQWADLSSTLVRDIARHGGDITEFVPDNIANAITSKLA